MNACDISEVYSVSSKNEKNVFQTVSHCHHVFIHQVCFSADEASLWECLVLLKLLWPVALKHLWTRFSFLISVWDVSSVSSSDDFLVSWSSLVLVLWTFCCVSHRWRQRFGRWGLWQENLLFSLSLTWHWSSFVFFAQVKRLWLNLNEYRGN